MTMRFDFTIWRVERWSIRPVTITADLISQLGTGRIAAVDRAILAEAAFEVIDAADSTSLLVWSTRTRACLSWCVTFWGH